VSVRFTAAPRLDSVVARMIAPEVDRIAEQVASAAAKNAPLVKGWRTQGDALVRPWHRSANRQKAPANLRFIIDHSPRKNIPKMPGSELLRFPRDPQAYYLQTKDCRCYLEWNHELAESIAADRAVAAGTRVSGKVSTTYPRAAESEFGTDNDPPARFMGRGIKDVAATL
jgi:hypothetical protein